MALWMDEEQSTAATMSTGGLAVVVEAAVVEMAQPVRWARIPSLERSRPTVSCSGMPWSRTAPSAGGGGSAVGSGGGAGAGEGGSASAGTTHRAARGPEGGTLTQLSSELSEPGMLQPSSPTVSRVRAAVRLRIELG